MDITLNPCSSKANLRNYLERLNEFGEFDTLVMRFIEDCLNQRVIRRPSKGPYGEQGKDFVAIENEMYRTYCSYVIKEGNLNTNLKGPYGIIKQMNDAMFEELEEKEIPKRKRTVTVVYNGYDGYRGAVREFEDAKVNIEERAYKNGILLRRIERWDLSMFTEKFFPFCDKILAEEGFRNMLNHLVVSYRFVSDFKFKYSRLKIDEQNPSSETEELVIKMNKDIVIMEDQYGPLQKIKNK
jgi:hypothetical protein